MTKEEFLKYLNKSPENTNSAMVVQMLDTYADENGSGAGQLGIGENAETFNAISPERATGKASHIEGLQNYTKEYKNVAVSNIDALSQSYEIDVDINKDLFPNVMELYQNNELKFSFITNTYGSYSDYPINEATPMKAPLTNKVYSFSDISALVPGAYDIKLVSGLALGDRSHVEGNNNIANARESHVEGWNNMATSWTKGDGTKVGDAVAAHVEGRECRAVGRAAHAEGRLTRAIGAHSHTEGACTMTMGEASHAEGDMTAALGCYSHAEGLSTQAKGNYCHAEGWQTIASREQHVQGRCNIEDTTGRYAHIVGNGTDELNRSNAHTLDWDGNAWYAGDVEGKSMIVKSSTPGSAKSFRITVNDAGAITASEVLPK